MKPAFVLIVAFICYKSAFSQTDKEKDGSIICPIELAPSFPGGFDSLRRFISTNLIKSKKTFHYEGKVFVGFVINEDGSTSDFRVVKGLCDECDRRALEALQKMPKWIPAKSTISGDPIRWRYIMPVLFRY